MRNVILTGLLAALVVSPAWPQSSPATPGSAPAPSSKNAKLLQTVTVTGEQPGPGLWKVSKDGHVMWVLGTLSPLPKHMEWKTTEVEQTLERSQEMIEQPRAEVKVDASFFTKLAMLPSVYGARKNPDGKDLQQILPPEIYAHWQAVKPRYFGSDSGIEYWRPILVAWKLYQKALDQAGLTGARDVAKVVQKLADRHDIKRTPVKYQLVVAHPRDALDAVKQTNLHDISCFNQTLTTVDHDMDTLTERANAWSTGDIDTLRNMAINERQESCLIAVINADVSGQLGLHDLPQQIEAVWQQAAQAAMARNAQTFAILPMEEILSPDGYLAHLKARGYTVQSPEDLDNLAP
jgi:uncharacterized protein YbaP (TraB family)